MSKNAKKQVTKKDLIYAINLNTHKIDDLFDKVMILSGLVHNYIECNKHTDKLKHFLEVKKQKQDKENKKSKKETKDAS